MRSSSRLFLAITASLAGCVQAPPPPPPLVRAARPAPPPPPVPATPTADWRDRRVAPGTWTYQRDARGSRALFGPLNADARLVLRCDRGERQVFLSRAGSATGTLTIRTTSATRALSVRPTGGALPYVAAALASRDPLLDAMAFSRGRFAIEQPGIAPLVLPAWAEIGRVIEDCRR